MQGGRWPLDPLSLATWRFSIHVSTLSTRSLFPTLTHFFLQPIPGLSSAQIRHPNGPQALKCDIQNWALQPPSNPAPPTISTAQRMALPSTWFLKPPYAIMSISSLFFISHPHPPPMPLNLFSFCAPNFSCSILCIPTLVYHLTPGLRQQPSTQSPCLNFPCSHLSSTLP